MCVCVCVRTHGVTAIRPREVLPLRGDEKQRNGKEGRREKVKRAAQSLFFVFCFFKFFFFANWVQDWCRCCFLKDQYKKKQA